MFWKPALRVQVVRSVDNTVVFIKKLLAVLGRKALVCMHDRSKLKIVSQEARLQLLLS